MAVSSVSSLVPLHSTNDIPTILEGTLAPPLLFRSDAPVKLPPDTVPTQSCVRLNPTTEEWVSKTAAPRTRKPRFSAYHLSWLSVCRDFQYRYSKSSTGSFVQSRVNTLSSTYTVQFRRAPCLRQCQNRLTPFVRVRNLTRQGISLTLDVIVTAADSTGLKFVEFACANKS